MNKLIIGSLSLLLLYSCKGSDDTEIHIPDTKGVEISFGSQVSSSSISSSVTSTSTRDVFENGSGLPVGHRVGVYGIPALIGDEASYTLEKFANEDEFQEFLYNASYEVMSTTVSKSTLSQTFIAKFPAIATGKNALSLYGYYPYTSNVGTSLRGFTIPIELNQNDMAKTTDYLYTGQIMAPVQKDPVELPLKHALARLDFKLYSTDNWILDNPVELESIEIKANRSTIGTMDIRDGAIQSTSSALTPYTYPTPGKVVEHIFDSEVGTLLPNLEPIAKCLLMPFNGSISTIVCNFKDADGTKKKYTVYDRKSGPSIVLEKGKITTINLLYLPKDIKISANIVMWDKSVTYDLEFKESEITN